MASTKRVCLITGAGGLLGSAFCEKYADHYDIAAVYRNRLPKLASQEVRPFDPMNPKNSTSKSTVFAIQADLTQPQDIKRAVELTLAHYGRIDVLINNAGLYQSAPLADHSAAELGEKLYNINVNAALRMSQEVIEQSWRYEYADNRGNNRNIINISSSAGVIAYPNMGQALYAASKTALNMMTLHMSYEYVEWFIRVNGIAPTSFPGIVSTESVVQSMAQLDSGDMTGTIRVLERNGNYLIENGTMLDIKKLHGKTN